MLLVDPVLVPPRGTASADLTAERRAAIEARDNETKRTMSFGCSSRRVSHRSWRSLGRGFTASA